MRFAVIAAGFVVQTIAWRLVAKGRFSLWNLMIPVLAVFGAIAAVTRPPVASGRVSAVTAASVGLAAGLALYAATLAFVSVAVRWEPFRSHVARGYAKARDVSPALAFLLGVVIAVPAEEMFWRGLAQPRLQAAMPALSGPGLAWLCYVAANAASGSFVFFAGAAVGGAVWASLALWTRGLLASVLCHAVWTTGMLLRPPRAGEAAA